MSKIVLIHRQLSFAQQSHTDADVLDWFNQAFKSISPYWSGKIVGTGLSPAEQKLLMPYLHGVETDDKEFRKATENFFHSLLTKVPPLGLKLEIGLENDALPVSENNMPLNIQDFVVYRHAIKHPKVAMSKDEADRNPTKHFYVEDPDHISTVDIEINTLEDKAIAAYFKYKDDELKVDQILTVLGVNLKGLTTGDKTLKLKGFSRKTEGKGEVEQRSELQRFVDVCDDQDLAIKYLLQELVGAQILEKAGSNIIIKETGQLVGENVKAAVLYLKNPKNSKVYNMLRGQYQTIVRKEAPVPDLEPAALPADIDAVPETGRKKDKPVAE